MFRLYLIISHRLPWFRTLLICSEVNRVSRTKSSFSLDLCIRWTICCSASKSTGEQSCAGWELIPLKRSFMAFNTAGGSEVMELLTWSVESWLFDFDVLKWLEDLCLNTWWIFWTLALSVFAAQPTTVPNIPQFPRWILTLWLWNTEIFVTEPSLPYQTPTT